MESIQVALTTASRILPIQLNLMHKHYVNDSTSFKNKAMMPFRLIDLKKLQKSELSIL